MENYNIDIFNEFSEEYDKWFEENEFVYQSELKAVKPFIPLSGLGLEIGVGSGRFAVPLGIKTGIEPSKAMADIARKRGIKVTETNAENLPLDDNSFDYAVMIVTICFVEDPVASLKEARRVIKPGGNLIVGLIDLDSFLGKIYQEKKKNHKFYKEVTFYSAKQVIEWMEELNLTDISANQTLFKHPKDINAIEPVKLGIGEGGFVVISGKK
ncbi:MAG TPA: class I SAM-dependent methyltransferase [Firmicutes bacterium]|nr:class I SAM-dependent methyltransferase [Bacillota bacterium]